ncbi:MAG: hypothetical protein ABWZ66_08010 [Pyrinomonadaceae bacterium]
MLILLTILVVISAVITISVILKTRKDRNFLTSEFPKQVESMQFRGLFEPDEAEIRALEREEKARIEAEKAEELRRVFAQKAEKLREFQEFWEMSPNRRNTVQLISLAAQTESGNLFSETAETAIEHWKANKIEDLSATNLAQILESHFWLLPNEERTSGVSFWIKQEIAGLRGSSIGKN